MCSVGGATGRKVRRQGNFACRNIEMIDRAVEERQRGNGYDEVS